MEHTHLYFIAFIYVFIIACRWWEPHIMEWDLSLWLPATNKNSEWSKYFHLLCKQKSNIFNPLILHFQILWRFYAYMY